MPTEMLCETQIVLKNIRTCGSMTNCPAFPRWGLEFDFQTHPTARTQVSDHFPESAYGASRYCCIKELALPGDPPGSQAFFFLPLVIN